MVPWVHGTAITFWTATVDLNWMGVDFASVRFCPLWVPNFVLNLCAQGSLGPLFSCVASDIVITMTFSTSIAAHIIACVIDFISVIFMPVFCFSNLCLCACVFSALCFQHCATLSALHKMTLVVISGCLFHAYICNNTIIACFDVF